MPALSYRRKAQIDITRLDWIMLALAIPAIPAWLAASDPFLAVLLLTTADLLGFDPTLRKAWSRPHEDHLGFFALGAVRNVFIILALETSTWTTLLFPVAAGTGCLIVAMVLLLRRAAVRQSMAAGSENR